MAIAVIGILLVLLLAPVMFTIGANLFVEVDWSDQDENDNNHTE